MAELDLINEYAQELLDVCEGAVAAVGEIDRSYIAPPGPAFDCGQLTVEIRSLGDHPLPTSSSLGSGRRLHAAINLVGFRVKVVGCVPTLDSDGDPPEPADAQAAAFVLNKMVYSIWTRVRTVYKEGEIFGGNCNALFFDGARALDELGGLAGYEIDFRAEIEGFANAGS